MTQKNQKVIEQVVGRIITRMEEGNLPSWTPGRNVALTRPYNVVRKSFYRGLNSLILSSYGYEYNAWGTYKNWNSLGTHIRKGEHGSLVIGWNRYEREVETRDSDGAVSVETKIHWYPFAWTVFNITQTALTEEEIQGMLDTGAPQNEVNLTAEQISQAYLDRSLVAFSHSASVTPHYNITKDAICMPGLDVYHEADRYYSTLFHEEAHSTGAATRLDRFVEGTQFGDETYSEEELVAEMASSMLCAVAGIANAKVFDNQVAYLKGWLETFKGDPNMILRASSAAQKAVDYILGEV